MYYCLRTVNCTLSLTCQLANAMQRGATSKEAPNQRQTRSQDFPQKLFTSRRIQPGLEDKNYSQFTALHPGFSFSAHGSYWTVQWRWLLLISTHHQSWLSREEKERSNRGDGEWWWRLTVHPLLLPVSTHADYTEGWSPNSWLSSRSRVGEGGGVMLWRGSVCVLRRLRGREKFHTFH